MKTQDIGLASFKTNAAILTFSAYNTNIAVHTPETVRFLIPKEQLNLVGKTMQYVVLNRDTAVHDQIRRDFAGAGLLKDDFVLRPDRLGNIRQMGQGRSAEQLAGDRLPDYFKAWEQSLTLKPLDAATGSFATTPTHHELTLRLAAPAVLVLVVK